MKEIKQGGGIPKNWRKVILKDILEYEQPQKYLVKNERYDECVGVPVLTAGKSFILGYAEERFGIYKNVPAIIFDDFTTDSKYVTFPFKLKSSAIKILKAKDNNDLFFLYNVLQILNVKPGSEHKRFWISEYSKKSIIIPPPNEQLKISKILETIDSIINKTDRIIEKYKRIKQGLMQDLLTKGIDDKGQIRSETTHKFKDSPLGKIPEEWKIVELQEVANILLSNVDKKIALNEIKVKLCNYLEVYQNEYVTLKLNFSDGSVNIKEYQKFRIDKGDVIITKDSETFNDIAKPAFVKDEIPNLICGYHLCLLKPRKILGLFLSKTLSQSNVNKQFQNLANGITRFGITKETIEKAKIPLPSSEEQKRISSILSQIDEVIEKEQKYKEKLERIKRGLMEDLLTGKVRVSNLIKKVEENVS